MCKGASSIVDFDPIVHAVALGTAAMGMRVWYEHVDSNASIADGGSREGVADPVAAQAGVALAWAHDPGWPADLRELPPSFWIEYARRVSRA